MDYQELYNDGKWKLVKETAPLLNGKTKTAVRAFRCDTVHIIALHEGKILLLREYRAFDREWVWMLPSGLVDKENDLVVAAHRELQEETGFRAKKLRHFVTAQHSETFMSRNNFYIAEDLVPDPLPQDEDEQIEVHHVSLSEAIEKTIASPHMRMPSVFGLLLFAREHPQMLK